MFPIGYYFINTHEKLIQLSYSYAISLGLFIFVLLISNFFNIGTSDYLENSVYFGSGRVNITKPMLILILTGPLALSTFKGKGKYLFILFLFMALFLALIGIKRSVLLSTIASFLIFGLCLKNNVKLVMSSIICFIIMAVTLTAFNKPIEIFLSRLEAREDQLEISRNTMEAESRYLETNLVINKWIDGSITHKIFGSEMFNDRYFFNTNRMLHTDYMVVINGSGLFGVILFFLVYISIIFEKEKYWRKVKHYTKFKLYNPIFYSIIASQLLMSISGTIHHIELRSFIFLYLGAIVGSLRGETRKKLIAIANKNSTSSIKHAKFYP